MADSPNPVRFFDYPLQFKARREDYLKIIEDVFDRGSFILGKDVEEFERNLAGFIGTKHAVGVGNCTDGIFLALFALGIGNGDEVISVSHTFMATIETVLMLGAKPVFVDIADDHNMDVDRLEAAITPKTKAIIPVQLNGRICSGMDRLIEIADRHSLIIVEDSAQAIGAKFKGKTAGTFGRAGCFSFYPAKILGTFGDAGAIVTDDDDFSRRLRMMRNHGRGETVDVELLGLNSRIDTLHAAILNYKLSFLGELITRRREIARLYDSGLKDVEEIRLPPGPVENGEHFDVYQNYELEAENRDNLIDHLEGKGIETAVQWGGKGVHQFKALGFEDVDLPRTEEFLKKGMMLPIYPGLENHQVEYVIESIRGFYGAK